MAEKYPYTLEEPCDMLYSSVAEKSAPRNTPGATPKFSGTFGIGEKDFKALLPIMVQAIQGECGGFSGNPEDYYLACMSGKMAAKRVRAKAELDAMGKGQDEAFKIREKAEKRATVYEKYPGILQASSQFDIELARLDGGKIVDIVEPHARAQAGKDLFYSGAKVVPRVAIQGFRRKTVDAKDGCTGFLQNVLFIAKGPKIDLGGGGPSNQDVFGGFANYSDYDPLAMAPGADSNDNAFAAFTGNGGAANSSPAAGSSAGANPPAPPGSPNPPAPPVDPNRPADAAYRHDNGDGTEQWHVNGAWDGGKHPIPSAAPPPPNNPPAPPASAGNDAPQW